jgi:hypothetical protein
MTEHTLEFPDEQTKRMWQWWWARCGQAQFAQFAQAIPRAKPVRSSVVRRSDVVRHSGSGSVPVVLGGDNEVKHPEF